MFQLLFSIYGCSCLIPTQDVSPSDIYSPCTLRLSFSICVSPIPRHVSTFQNRLLFTSVVIPRIPPPLTGRGTGYNNSRATKSIRSLSQVELLNYLLLFIHIHTYFERLYPMLYANFETYLVNAHITYCVKYIHQFLYNI